MSIMNDMPADGPPERDLSKPAEQQGVFRKFDVQRTDGSDQPGGKHYGCEYFVLDVAHDPHAKPALEAYAVACAATHPQLSADMSERYGLQPQAAEPETNDATFGAILFAFVRMSLVYPTEAQLHQLDRLIAFYGDQKFASQLKLLAHQARTPHVNRDVGRARPLVFSGSEGIGRKEQEIEDASHDHEDLKQLAEAALREHDGTEEGFHNWRTANRALRRKTHPVAILSLLSELNALRAALQPQSATESDGAKGGAQ